MLPRIEFEPKSLVPVYQQLHQKIKSAILSGRIVQGERLPPTRELACSLGLSRATVAAAYELLESEKLVKGRVGRGSFVEATKMARLDWDTIVPRQEFDLAPAPRDAVVSFSASRPPEDQFPIEEFRATCREVIDSPHAAEILQLGPPQGYGPLRRYILAEAHHRGVAGPGDDILITSGCQQAFDLIQRVLASHGETVVLEDPVYPGLRNVFSRGGARVLGTPVGDHGVEVEPLARLLEKERPRLMILTPDFQNPTGTTIPEDARKE
ncbi:MAG: PLP-dependent aminotransferase family protein, partial [Bryobacteraceae bacterium]